MNGSGIGLLEGSDKDKAPKELKGAARREFDQHEFDNFALRSGLISFRVVPTKLSNGSWESHVYANWRPIVSHVYKKDILAEHFFAFLKDMGLDPSAIIGVPAGTSWIGGYLHEQMVKRQSTPRDEDTALVSIARESPKDHGAPEDRYFVGGAPRSPVVVVEDVTVTGDSALEFVKVLQGMGIKVLAVVALTNRHERRSDGKTPSQALSELGVKYLSMSTFASLLPRAVIENPPPQNIIDALEHEWLEHGITPIKLQRAVGHSD